MALTFHSTPWLTILWAQWRAALNRRRRAGDWLAAIGWSLWHALWSLLAVSLGLYCATSTPAALRKLLPPLLLGVTFYWQLAPIIAGAGGVSLALQALRIYPIPHSRLFGLEVLLRATAVSEMVIIVAGLLLGLLANPGISWLALPAIALFAGFNLLLSCALRSMLAHFTAVRHLREIAVLLVALAAATPALLIQNSVAKRLDAAMDSPALTLLFPWGATASAALGRPLALSILLAWLGCAWAFARWQFARTASVFTKPLQPRGQTRHNLPGADWLWRAAAIPFPDPLSAAVEKEIRSLARSARFRLLFLMGFTFGPLVCLPLKESAGSQRYLTAACLYAVLLLGDLTIWNHLGLDRKAACAWFCWPAPFRSILMAKNYAAAFFLLLNSLLITAVCWLAGLRFAVDQIAESAFVLLTFLAFVISLGNLLSIKSPRAVDPFDAWRNQSSGKTQFVLLAIYPLLAVPIALAFLARHVLHSEAAFYAVLTFDLLGAAVLYRITLQAAEKRALTEREQLLQALYPGQGLIR